MRYNLVWRSVGLAEVLVTAVGGRAPQRRIYNLDVPRAGASGEELAQPIEDVAGADEAMEGACGDEVINIEVSLEEMLTEVMDLPESTSSSTCSNASGDDDDNDDGNADDDKDAPSDAEEELIHSTGVPVSAPDAADAYSTHPLARFGNEKILKIVDRSDDARQVSRGLVIEAVKTAARWHDEERCDVRRIPEAGNVSLVMWTTRVAEP